MGQIEDFKLFVTVVDQGSIAKAAVGLGIAKSAVSRRLGQLESRYDITLIDRKPGTWQVTEAGKELYQRVTPLLADAEDLDADFSHAPRMIRGPLRVTVPYEYGMEFLRPMLLRFTETHPEIELSLDFDDRLIDLERENYDLAIRITSGHLGEVSEVKLGSTRHGLFASPDYLRQRGEPREPCDLGKHTLLQYGANRRPTWRFSYKGKPANVQFKAAMNSNSGFFLREAAVKGRGIIHLPGFVVARALEAGFLVPVLPEAEFPEFGIHLIHSPRRRMNKRMRAFVSATRAHCDFGGREFADRAKNEP